MAKLTKKPLEARKFYADPMDFINQAIRVSIEVGYTTFLDEFLALYDVSCKFLEKEGYLRKATKGKYKGKLVACRGWPLAPLDLWSKK